ncbi:AbrB family transcriptional regulator [Paenibacillus sp. OV219]|uniref:AbrB family transcriptional regulator n=1 Tax=Paenibacillus sp. OV219 TaxID=1884377 RepID=UPI0008B02061|nr:AbrB family transcriptional regulator [Paenibacillus sp. OV219]SEO31035.1 hypothetical protein SAMN05518847_10757 [Paenibacillus sp. OV219]
MGKTLITALLGGALFMLLHAPIPWLIGPMLAVLIGSKVFGRTSAYRWPSSVRNAGMITVGYTIGLAMTATALAEMSHQLLSMVLMIVLLLLFCAGMAFAVAKLSGTDFKTALLGSVPGGLTQVLALAEETKGVNVTIVTVTQVIRLMMIIVCIPIIVFSPLIGGTHDTGGTVGVAVAVEQLHHAVATWSGLFPGMLWFAPVAIGCALLGSRVNFPTAYLLGPAIGTAVLQLLCGLEGPALPALFIDAAQLMIGAYVGLLLKPEQLENKLRTISLAVGSGLLLIVGAWGFSLLLTKLYPIWLPTALLSLAPGGMDQMGIIAHEIDADLSMVAGYQLFRMFFIFFAVPPLLRLLFRRSLKRSSSKG